MTDDQKTMFDDIRIAVGLFWSCNRKKPTSVALSAQDAAIVPNGTVYGIALTVDDQLQPGNYRVS